MSKFELEISKEDIDKHKLSSGGESVRLKEFLGFIEDNVCTTLELGFDCDKGFSSLLELSGFAIDSGRLYFIANDNYGLLANSKGLLSREFMPQQLIELGTTTDIPSSIKILETLDLNLIVGFAAFGSDRSKIVKADQVDIGLSVMSSLQTNWIQPHTLSLWGSFLQSKKHLYPLPFSKAKNELLKGNEIARLANEEEEIFYFLDQEFVYERYREVISLAKLSKTMLTSKYRIVK